LIFKYGLIPQERRQFRELGRRTVWFASSPPWDAGRAQLLALDQSADGQLTPTDVQGASDIPALWGVDEGLAFWGGEAATPRAALETCARVVGAPPSTAFDATADWLAGIMAGLTPPAFPDPLDGTLVERGSTVFAGACASCHAEGGERTGTIVPLAEIGTDPERARAGRSDGYLSRPLTGAWLLGPYLHNGSVPSMADLIETPERRPAAFFRGYDLIDRERVGFVSSGAEAQRQGERFDIGVPGNGNGGHLYGTDLSEADKQALLEFLKTL
jgi:mono/diheme cytochrome c family protein